MGTATRVWRRGLHVNTVSRGATSLIVCVAAAAGLLALAPTAYADEDPTAQTTDALNAVPGLTSTSAKVASTSDADSALVTTTDGVSVDAPKDPSSGIKLDTPAAPPITIGIPGASVAGDGVKTENGVVVYPNATPDSSVAVQANTDGTTRFLTIISGSNAPSDYRFPMDLGGGSLAANPDGSIALLDAQGDSIGNVATPWSTDANKATVPARFVIEGSTLVLHVDHQGAAYPVVADPAVSFDCGWVTCSAYLSRSATRSVGGFLARYQNASAGAIGGAAATACASTGVGVVVAGVCGAVGAAYGGFLIDQFNQAVKTNACIRFRYTRLPFPPFFGGPVLIYVDRSSYCKNS